MTICAEEAYYKVRIAAARPDGTTGLLDARLPVDRGINPLPAPIRVQRVPVSLLATKEKKSPWGPPGSTTQVDLATAVTCGYAKRSFDWHSTWSKPAGRSGVDDWLRTTKRNKDPSAVLVGKIKASHKVPVQHFASVLSLFRLASYEHVHFYYLDASLIPTAQARKLKGMAYPVENALPRVVHGHETDSGPGDD